MDYKEVHKTYTKDILKTLKEKTSGVLSDDFDSFVSMMIVKKYSNIKPSGFFSPEIFAINKSSINNLKDVVGLDMTLDKNNKMAFKTISNHIERFYGYGETSTSISCNYNIDDFHYQKKSLFSTTLMLWETLKIPLPETEKGKMFLLSIDSTFLQYYHNSFQHIIIENLKAANMEELIDVLKNKTKQDFYDLQDEYGLKDNIAAEIKDGKLQIKIKEYLEDKRYVMEELGIECFEFDLSFDKWCVLKRGFCTSNEYLTIREKEKNIFSYAITYKGQVSYSVVDKIEGGDGV